MLAISSPLFGAALPVILIVLGSESNSVVLISISASAVLNELGVYVKSIEVVYNPSTSPMSGETWISG
jgi:hypothetical protein